MNDRLCSVDGCSSDWLARGLCRLHYGRNARYGSTDLPVREKRVCTIDDCPRPFKGHGMCDMHLRRFKSNGDPRVTRVPRWTGEGASYGAMHKRVCTLWGRAALYPCVLCPNSAKQWAYDGTDPSELRGYNGPSGKHVLNYSVWPEFYMPLCVSCHKTRDMQSIVTELEEYRAWKNATGLTVNNIPFPESYTPTQEEREEAERLWQTQ